MLQSFAFSSPPRLTSPASATSSAIVLRPALLSPYRPIALSPKNTQLFASSTFFYYLCALIILYYV